MTELGRFHDAIEFGHVRDKLIADALDPEPDGLPLYLEDGVDYGWRLWRVESFNGRPHLRSLFKPAIWEPRKELHARCWHDEDVPSHRARVAHTAPTTVPGTSDGPTGIHACGIWAFPRRELPWLLMWTYAAADPPDLAVEAFAVGRVKLWGRIVERERGYLAEYAYPDTLELYDPEWLRTLKPLDAVAIGHLHRLAGDLAADYLIPVTVADHRRPNDAVIVASRDLAEQVGVFKRAAVVPTALMSSFNFNASLVPLIDPDAKRQADRYFNRAGFFLAIAALAVISAVVNVIRGHLHPEIRDDVIAIVALAATFVNQRRYVAASRRSGYPL